jgi:hypothetical protein
MWTVGVHPKVYNLPEKVLTCSIELCSNTEMTKVTTFYIKCSEEEAAAIRTAAKKRQRTIHNWLRMVVLFKDERLELDPCKAKVFFAAGQEYITIPVTRVGSNVLRPTPETGLEIIMIRKKNWNLESARTAEPTAKSQVLP